MAYGLALGSLYRYLSVGIYARCNANNDTMSVAQFGL
jgi:hypothetical protein